MIRRTVAFFITSLALSFAAQANPPRPVGKTIVVCPHGETSFSFQFMGKTVDACKPASATAFCAAGRVYVRSPATGQSTCTALKDASWYCPAKEKPRNFAFTGRLETLCEPATPKSLCAAGRVYVRSPATGQSACSAVKDASWYCPSGENPTNFMEGGNVATACVPASGNACGAGRHAVRNTAVNRVVCMK